MYRLARCFCMLLLSSLASAENMGTLGIGAAPCSTPQDGPALMRDPRLQMEDHPGTRVIDYGEREPAGEFEHPLGIECRVVHDTAPVAQWIARPPPKGQVAGSIPARGTNSPREKTAHTALLRSTSRFPASTGRAR
jgi:hypothetical protein